MEDTPIVASNGTVVEAGGVYLTFSGDCERPYKLAKVISVGGSGAAMDCQISPDLVPMSSPDLWLKLYLASVADYPVGITPEVLSEGFRIIPVSVSMFLAWGPPNFPVLVGNEPVTAEELAGRVQDWYMQPKQGV